MATDREANQDIARLLESAVASAKRRLGNGVVFAPFGFALGPTGLGEELKPAAPKPAEAFAELSAAVTHGISSKRWRAAVVVFPSKVLPKGGSEKIDAIGLEVKHARVPGKRLLVPLEHDITGKVRVIGKRVASKRG